MSYIKQLTLIESVEDIRRRIGSVMLSDDDLILLALEEIARTTTYEEQSYRQTGYATPADNTAK